MAESIETRVVPVSIKLASVIILSLISLTGGFMMWALSIKTTVDRNCHDITKLEAKTAEIDTMRTSMAVVTNDLGYIKGSLVRIERAIDRNEQSRVDNRRSDSTEESQQ